MRELSQSRDLAGRIATVDALHAQHETMRCLHERGADYLVTIKDNQQAILEDLRAIDFTDAPSHETVDKGHSRIERRRCAVADLSGPEWDGYAHFHGRRQAPAGKWIVDFGWEMSEADAALYEAPFRYVKEHVRPMRQRNRRESYRLHWWRHVEPRQGLWQALDGLPRFIATPTVSKHRLFVWMDAGICPDHQLIVIARDDDVTFGILHSRFHEAWALRLGTWLGKGNDPRYTPTTTFETFPFPDGLSPDIPASDYADDPHAVAVAGVTRGLVELRERWLNPPEWVEWVDKPVPGYPKRPVARDEAAAKQLKARTLTNLYNDRPQWLADAHAALDAAVAAAYGWDAGISEDAALCELLKRNLSGGPTDRAN